MSKNKNKLLDANTAVASYLDNLLQEATEPKPVSSVKLKNKDKLDNVHVIETPLTKAKLIHDNDFIDAPLQQQEEALDKCVEDNSSNELEPDVSTKDEAFEFPVQCLMFRVNNNLLAIPLVKMGSVVPFGDKLTQLPHSPNYFKGLLKHRENNVKVADSTTLLMGVISGQTDDDFNPSHLLVFENDDWAISCDELLDVVTLNEEDIKWHESKNHRLSLGTIKKTLALVLSPEAICQKLVNSDVKIKG